MPNAQNKNKKKKRFSGFDQNKTCLLICPAASNKCLNYTDDILFMDFEVGETILCLFLPSTSLSGGSQVSKWVYLKAEWLHDAYFYQGK